MAKNKENGERVEAIAMAALTYPIAGDDSNYDNFLSQFVYSLIYAARDEGDPTFWFGRVIAYATDGSKCVFGLNGDSYSMAHIMNLIKNKDMTITFVSVNPLTAASYTRVANGVQAKLIADIIVTDNREPTSRPTPYTVRFTHIIRPTWVSFNTDIQ